MLKKLKNNGFVITFLTMLCVVYFYTNVLFSEISNFSEKHQEVQPNFSVPIHRSCYSMQYDGRTKNAAYVYERLTEECLKGESKRHSCQFVEDNLIHEILRSTLSDYLGSGFDRGHLAPAANHKSSLIEMKDTFYLSNISPQHPQFNRGYWAKLEKYVRELTKKHSIVHVFTGPLFIPQTCEDGQRWVKYRVIGKNDVAVPTHFFKILFLENSPENVESIAYILPNEPIEKSESLEKFKTTVQKVEKVSGIIFRKS